MLRRMKDAGAQICERDAIERAKLGDPTGVERLYELHRPRIYSLCLRHTGNVFDADDLTQDVFIQVFKKVRSFRGDARFTTWLYKVALNFVRLHAREQRRHGRFLDVNVSEQRLCSVKSRSCNPAQRVALRQALSSLTPVRRLTLLLHDIQGFTHNEVANRLGVSVIASKSRLHRAHLTLRDILELGATSRSPRQEERAD
jgi:RNA polymerase sigma-70 factor (ECF subfamily)